MNTPRITPDHAGGARALAQAARALRLASERALRGDVDGTRDLVLQADGFVLLAVRLLTSTEAGPTSAPRAS